MSNCCPDNKGNYGVFGGRFVNEDLDKVLEDVKQAFYKLKNDEKFNQDFEYYMKQYVGRPSPLYFAEKLTKKLGGAQVYLKREDLNHTGSHKINNVIGQALLAKYLGKKRVIAETGAGQHGVATATACALFDMKCIIYMGEEDCRRQELNVFRMQMLGAEVIPVKSGTRTLKDAVDVALFDLVQNFQTTYYMLGSAVGPDPYPEMVKYFQSIISKEIKSQLREITGINNILPNYVIACVGGGSNAIGAFSEFIDDPSVGLIGVEPAGKGLDTPFHAATITKGTLGMIHGFKCYLLQDENGEPLPVHSIAAGLDYPGVGPEHCYYNSIKRATYVSVTDKEAINAFLELSKNEGIIPAIESSHAIAYAMKFIPSLPKDDIVVINVSGRGDKDVAEIASILALENKQ